MFRKYEKTCRILLPDHIVSLYGPGARNTFLNKKILSNTEVKELLTGKVIIEEKIDGANVGIIPTGKPGEPFRLQKRGSLVDASEHAQYNRFKAWAWERYESLATLSRNYLIYGEFMWATHHIYYDQLPDWFICYDIYDHGKQEYLSRERKEEICSNWNIPIIPLLFCGYVDERNDVYKYFEKPKREVSRSAYSSTEDREGIVIKNYRKQMRGKIVRPDFIKEIDENGVHWTTKWDSRRVNKLKEETDVSTQNAISGS